MNDNETMTTAETTEATQNAGAETTAEAFLAGWEDAPETAAEEAAPADQPEAAPDAELQPETAAEEEPTAPPAPEETQEQAADQPPAVEAPKQWTLRHLDEVKTVGEADMVSLAQKGLDYDRIRTKYDESKPVMELFGQFAKNANMTIPDYVAHIRQQAKEAQGMKPEEARRAVELEDREARVAVQEAEAQQAKAAESAKSAADAKRAADIAEFQKTFPEAARDPKSIPQEVWAGVRQGLSLVAAYSKWQVAQAKADAEAAKQAAAAQSQNQRNAVRATGSMKSAGEERKTRDPFLEGWDD